MIRMANAQLPLLFFSPLPNTDPLSAAESVVAGSSSVPVVPLDPAGLLHALKAQRGLSRLKISLPVFSFDNRRAEAAFEGSATETHINVRFYGNFEKLAQQVFRAFVALGLVCYSIWDKKLITSWPEWEEVEIDKGFAARMSRVLQHKEQELHKTEPDAEQRAKILKQFVNSPEFRAEMAKEARLEKPSPGDRKKTYSDVVNCYVCWRDGRPSAAELAAVRKLDPKYGNMSIVELRNMIGNAPRLMLLTGVPPRQAAMLQDAATQHSLLLDIEVPSAKQA